MGTVISESSKESGSGGEVPARKEARYLSLDTRCEVSFSISHRSARVERYENPPSGDGVRAGIIASLEDMFQGGELSVKRTIYCAFYFEKLTVSISILFLSVILQ